MSLGKKISELPVATTLTGLELAVVVQTSTTKQSTPEAITASVSSRLDNVVSVNNAALTSINNTVSALEIRVSAVSAAVVSINNVVSALEVRVSGVSATTSTLTAAITSVNAVVSLKVNRSGDTMTSTLAAPSFKINSTGGGSVLLAVVSTASSVIATFPATTGNLITSGDSGTVTQGMLAAGVVGNGPAFGAYLNTYQGVTNSVATKIQMNTEEFDTNSNYDSTTNYRFTPTVAGYYQITGYCILSGDSATLTNGYMSIYKNGSEFKRGNQLAFSTGNGQYFASYASSLVYLNGTTDYVEIYGFIVATSPYFFGGQQYTYFNGFLARAA